MLLELPTFAKPPELCARLPALMADDRVQLGQDNQPLRVT